VSADYPFDALVFGTLAFATGGALLSWLICLALRGLLPRLSRRAVLAVVMASVPILTILMLGLAHLAVEGAFSLSFMVRMQWEGWTMLIAAEVAGLLLARALAPAPRMKVDSSIFE